MHEPSMTRELAITVLSRSLTDQHSLFDSGATYTQFGSEGQILAAHRTVQSVWKMPRIRRIEVAEFQPRWMICYRLSTTFH